MRRFLFRNMARRSLFGTASIVAMLSLSIRLAAQTALSTNYIEFQIDKTGLVASVKDKKSGREYVPVGQAGPLLSLYKDGMYMKPLSMAFDSKKKTASFRFEGGQVATVKLESKGQYLRFELLSVAPRNGIEAAMWGPYPVTIGKLIGETVGIVRDDQFAVGIQSLKINTIEGIPDDGDNAGGGSFFDPLPGQKLPDDLKGMAGKPVTTDVNKDGDMPDYVRMYRGTAAVKKEYGSELRFYARDRRIARTIRSGGVPQEIKPFESDLTGSAIAFFGCPEPETLDLIEKIELGEGLPHPMLDGVWVKKSPRTADAYMLYEGKSVEKSLEYARQLNFKLIHMGDVFKTWGHFGLDTDRFPGAGAIKSFTDKARKDGISIGIHTLTTFTGTNDAYVTPVPNDSLQKAGSTTLAKDLDENDDVILIRDATFFQNPTSTRTIKIGKELIAYKGISGTGPWQLTGCVRGQFKTQKAAHKSGDAVDKLMNNSYGGFLPDINLQDRYAERLARVCNETGIDLMDFDGFEALDATGHGTFAENKFIDLWYKNLDRYRMTCGSNTSHYYWHIYTFMNWGEPWYSALRKSQVNYRIENQRYFERNLMPGMLGWFKLEESYRPEEIEWIQARSTGFNAGYLLRVDESVENNGYKHELFEAIREWQKARKAGVFSKEQKERMKSPLNEFHLRKTSEKSWDLIPVTLSGTFEHKYRQVQTGEPIISRFTFNNAHGAQPVRFYITAEPVEGNKTAEVSEISIEINNAAMDLGEALKAGDKVVCDGTKLLLCDRNWKTIRELSAEKLPAWVKGANEISVRSGFSDPQSPVLKFEFKSMGDAEVLKIAGL